MLDRTEFGNRLRAAREAANHTTADAAERLGMARGSYVQYEYGRRVPTVLKLMEWVETLDLDPQILVPEFFAKLRSKKK